MTKGKRTECPYCGKSYVKGQHPNERWLPVNRVRSRKRYKQFRGVIVKCIVYNLD